MALWGFDDRNLRNSVGATVGVVCAIGRYGLYSSFVGVFIYSFFATSKDVSIGPLAVMSLRAGKVIGKVQDEYGDQFSVAEIAMFLSLICGGIAAGVGILRLGFMSGSAFNIITGQVPELMGYNKSVNTKVSSFHSVIATLKKLPLTNVNIAFGLVPLFILFTWRNSCDQLGKRYPKKMWFFYFAQLRNAIVIIVATAITLGIVHPELKRFDGPKSKFKGSINTIGVVPSGLKHVGMLSIPDEIIDAMALEIPVSTIILLLEHIAISKFFGRVNDYKVVPDQELTAIGVNNLIGLQRVPSRRFFFQICIESQMWYRNTVGRYLFWLCSVVGDILFDFSVFPNATLYAVAIHAASDLISNWRSTWNLWEVNPVDYGIFIVAVFITVLSSIENGIYFAFAASAAVLLFRGAKPTSQFLGRIRVAEVVNPVIQFKDEESFTSSSSDEHVEIQQASSRESYCSAGGGKLKAKFSTISKTCLPRASLSGIIFVTKWVPLMKKSFNNDFKAVSPPPGVLAFRSLQAFSYPNALDFIDQVSDEANRLMRHGKPYANGSAGDRPWNDPGPLRWRFLNRNKNATEEVQQDGRPLLRIVHFDFSCAPSIDTTSEQALGDLRRALNNYTDREVEFHFSGIHSPCLREDWSKLALTPTAKPR